jgi:polyphosphate kinase 2
MKERKQRATIDTPYEGISALDYSIEKRRLQVELLKIQQDVAKHGRRMAIVVEGRDAAGKGSTIRRFTQHMIPRHFRVVELGIPTPKESKYWFNRYQRHFPNEGEIVFFDRSWYNRALIEPTMGYCTEKQYRYFMNKVLDWEHRHIDEGLMLVKFYLSVNKDNQLYRLEDRIKNPLTYWKFSENDLKARKKWERYTRYKEQMFASTSSEKSPWVVVNANMKRESRLTTMLYLVESFGSEDFVPLTGEDVVKTHSIEVGGVSFRGLSHRQYAVLQELNEQEKKLS